MQVCNKLLRISHFGNRTVVYQLWCQCNRIVYEMKQEAIWWIWFGCRKIKPKWILYEYDSDKYDSLRQITDKSEYD